MWMDVPARSSSTSFIDAYDSLKFSPWHYRHNSHGCNKVDSCYRSHMWTNRKAIASPVLFLRSISGNFGVRYLFVSFFYNIFQKRGLLGIGSDLLAYTIRIKWMPRLRSLIPKLCSGATRRIRDFDLRLRGCGICASEIYFSIFLENKEGKRLKWPSAWFCDST